MRALVVIGVVVLGLSCAGRQRVEALDRLPDDQKALYSKYRQFMTEEQQDTFLTLHSDDERAEFVRGLKVEERLAKFPPEIQDAIWQQKVVEGMSMSAVLLSLGSPADREWDEIERAKGNDLQRWTYHPASGLLQVILLNGTVIRVEHPKS